MVVKNGYVVFVFEAKANLSRGIKKSFEQHFKLKKSA
jgi:hypothetical protein